MAPNPMAKRIPPDTPPQQRLLAEVALIGGGAMLITSSVIHLLLWSDTYRAVSYTHLTLPTKRIV